jgi:class 3 adenylate cyclase
VSVPEPRHAATPDGWIAYRITGGEIELSGGDAQGLAVHPDAGVAALAGAGEVFVSATVKDLMAGSGIEFEDRGEHVLKGVPGEWRLSAVVGN